MKNLRFTLIAVLLPLVSNVVGVEPVAKIDLPDRIRQMGGVASSRVMGSPEPPAPYRVEKALPEFPIERLITFRFEPGTNKLVYVDQVKGAKGTRLMRYDFATRQTETLLEPDEFIYGMEFHPDFQKNGFVYLGTNGPASAERGSKRALIVRYTMDRNQPGPIDPGSAFEIMQWPSQGHNGTAIVFGSDGMLYVTSGDGSGDSDTDQTGQRLDLLLAKVLRVDVDHPDPGKPYSVPADNPFVGRPDARPETWAYGFRNPWRASWDPVLNRLWVGQNGQDRLEQIYLVERGANYGWSAYEGSRIFYETRKLGPTPVTGPTLEHGHHESRSLTGGSVYTGDQLPGLKGAYIYGDYTTGKIWGARHDGQKDTWHEELVDSALGVTDFRTGPQGEMLIANYQSSEEGGLYRLAPNPPNPDAPKFPRKLSETGLFQNVSKHQVNPELIPYSVTIPQWSDGAFQERYLALPSAEPRIGFGGRRGWEFPNGTVILQSLAVGEKDRRRWVETRMLARQEGEWVGYSYAWNDEQTDAVLVDKEGRDQEIEGRTWRFASRAECMVCHSRAANFIVGLQTGQMNRVHDYGDGFAANQLEVMDALGLFRKAGAPLDGPSLLRKPAEQEDRLVDPFDVSADLDLRARAYLHATCAHCHVEAGGGNSMMDLRWFIEPAKMKIFDEIPNHGTVGLSDESRIMVPGDPAKSVLFSRIARIGPGQMPPMGSVSPDPRGVALLLEWLSSVAAPAPSAP